MYACVYVRIYVGIYVCMYVCTVQTFNSCTSRLDVSQCLVVQTPKGNMSENDPKTSMTYVACDLKLRFVVKSSISGIWVKSGARSCIMPGMPAHLVQQLNVGTVCMNVCTYVCSLACSYVYFYIMYASIFFYE